MRPFDAHTTPNMVPSTKRRPTTPWLFAVGLGLLTGSGCGSDEGAGDTGGDTEDGSSSESASTTMDPSSTTAQPGTSDTSTTTADPTDTDTGSDTDTEGDTEDSETTGEPVDHGPYRIVYSSVSGGVIRLYSASEDLSHVEPLNPAGVDSVTVTGAASPRLNTDGRHIAFVRGPHVDVADVFTGQSDSLSADGLEVRTMEWSPSAFELAVYFNTRHLRRVPADGSESTLVHDFTDDGATDNAIFWRWGPLGDRFAIQSEPEGGTGRLWVVDADGTDGSPVAAPGNGVISSWGWAPSGDSVWFAANVSDIAAGAELALGERDGFEVLSGADGNVRNAVCSADGSRFAYHTGSGVRAVDADGSNQVLIGTPIAADAFPRMLINDAGTWVAQVLDGGLTVMPSTIYVPTGVHADGVNDRSIAFEPGGARLAYMRRPEPGAAAELYLLDGNGANIVSRPLEEAERIDWFRWAWGGQLYVVSEEPDDYVVGVYHTLLGEDPIFAPGPDEFLVVTLSDDGKRMVIRTGSDLSEDGTLCTFDTSDPTNIVELACTTYNPGNSGSFTAIAYDPTED
jgi:hypothetical protein